MSAPADPVPPLPKLPPRWVRPLLLVAAWTLLLAAVADVTGCFPPIHPANVFHWNGLRALFFVLVPALLLHALFCARRGAERGYATEAGMLPGLLLFGVVMFISGLIARSIPQAPGDGLLLLVAFATARADPPAPPRVRLVWALLAGAFGAWCVYVEPNTAGGIGALILYAGWSAWRGAESVVPTTENSLPVAPARRMIGMLLFVALVVVPTAVLNGAEFFTVLLSVAAGLILLDWCTPALQPANRCDPPP